MTKKQLILCSIAVLLVAGIYAYLYRDWFGGEGIQISHRFRPKAAQRSRAPAGFSSLDVTFGLNRSYEITSIKVIPVSDLQTNKYPQPIWHIASESNSPPIKAFRYGERIEGMKPKVPDTTPDPLVPNVTYRLFVEAGAVKGEKDFKPTK